MNCTGTINIKQNDYVNEKDFLSCEVFIGNEFYSCHMLAYIVK